MRDLTQVWVGLDVHKDSVSIAALRGDWDRPILEDRLGWGLEGLQGHLKRLHRQGLVRVCYEAGGFGFVLQRAIKSWGYACDVVAPSLIPCKPGDRVKTDRRDALKLAQLNRGRTLTYVYVPSEEDERARSVVRGRRALHQDVHRVQQRILKLLQARGHFFRGKSAHWGTSFLQWLRQLPLAEDDRLLVTTYLAQRDVQRQLRQAVEERIARLGGHPRWGEAIGRLQCLRGVEMVTASGLVAEIVDIERFEGASQLMAWAGLGMSEFSSGPAQVRGRITKTGNGEVRRLMLEAAWNNTHPPRLGVALRRRQHGQDPAVIAHAWRAQQRLHRTWRKLSPKNPKLAATAMARELLGFVHALWRARPEDLRARD
jgi:transposase